MVKSLVSTILMFFVISASAQGRIAIDSAGNLLKDGKPYQAIGVNYFSAFYRTVLNPNDKSYKEGFAELAKYNVPFARVMLGGFWPNEVKLYKDNPELYFKLLDEFIESARQNNIGIVASLNWNFATPADIVGEPASYIGVPGSKTQAFVKKYASDVVSRYANNQAIWLWEFGNELMLYADLPNSKLFRPKTDSSKGTPLIRNPLDELTAKDAISAFDIFANTVLSKQPTALLSTGNAVPRPYAWHNTNNKSTLKQWNTDSTEEFCEVLLRDNPSPYQTISIHLYPSKKDAYFGNQPNDYDSIVKVATQCAKDSKKVLFMGEFGADTSVWGDDGAKEEFLKILSTIQKYQVPLSALWVYDFSFHNNCCNVTSSNKRKYQLETIKKANSFSG